MGVSAFVRSLRIQFVREIHERPPVFVDDTTDAQELTDWSREAFGYWFLENRDVLLKEEWDRRGWIGKTPLVPLLEDAIAGKCAEPLAAWMDDRLA